MKTISLLFSLFLFCCCFAFCNAAGTKEDEVSALLAIRSGLIDPLDALHQWRTPASPQDSAHCNWAGVTCNSLGFVERLDLSHLNLSGVVAGDVRRLRSLTSLNLCCNAFSSSLPKSLLGLLSLVEFDVSENAFVGQFPTGLGSSPVLKVVNASSNNFVGQLPEDLSNATSLEVIDLRGSFFEGSISVSYRSLQKLKFLGLSGNNITGKIPAELGELSSLEKLIIGYNELEGSIPSEFGSLSNLQYLDLAIGNLDGTIPPELGWLQKLTTLFLYKNNLEGEVPKEIGNMSALEMLDISDNRISGLIPPELDQLKNLQLLNLMCNMLKGPVPAGIGDLPQLEVLELWNNSLSGPLPANLGNSSALQWLDVSSNALDGEIPTGLCYGHNLTKLILFNNVFSGPIPVELSTCMSLVRVRMQNNRINGRIPSGLGKLPKLQRLELANNELEGDIPSDLALSTSLSFIDLSHNHHESFLPSNIFSIPTLQSFMASDNLLTGKIPDQFQDCPMLGTLDLSNNRLTGGIPTSLTSCERLISLDLHGNRLVGDIPVAIAMMPALAILDLSNNLLAGTIPPNFGNSPALESLNLSYNNLSGPVPANGVLRTINPDELAGNSGLCGGVLPLCTIGADGRWPESQKSAHLKHIVAGWMTGLSAVIAFGIFLLGAHHLYKKWYVNGGCCNEHFEQENGAWPWQLTAFQRLSFTSGDIIACVKEANVIGMGATGIVYKAELQRPHAVVAVKKLWRAGTLETAEAGHSILGGDIAGEVNVLGKLRHRNIVRLLGYMHNDADTMILYEYMPNGSLWEALHGAQAVCLLPDWVSRYNVATGIAQGLAYLHHDCHPPIIHRDIKSNNILLDANLEARIADFGLARMMMRMNETVSVVAGSYGYIAPEYGYTLKVDQKSDIYSFGVLLMELLTGKRPIEPEFGEGQDVVGWVREKLSSRGIEAVLDANVCGQCKHVQEEMVLVLRIAVICTAKLPKDRPSMRDVLTMLGEAKPRRKSSSAVFASNVVDKDKPVFSTSPDSEYV
ncbi:MDIS1-interacting receptor like kinase 1-like [Canna indica]|uniref:MDIS1-interacting receptor like kinase 1-like n=1 Tax=Canna indica TaxID=4628 RepID=A0AAQ3KTM8_9LILI|nr:MDIS1-interacting receptor like kinase 1-like [Canna indica]